MKNVPIKFRGKELETGKYIYGYFTIGVNQFWQDIPYIIDKSTVWHAVDIDTVCQLAGYDAEGNEIYEGDEVEVYHLPPSAKLTGDEESYGIYKASIYAEVGGEAIGGTLTNNGEYSFLKKGEC